LSGEIASGRVSAPGWSDPRLRQAWLKNSWRGTPVPDIDPGKLANAVETKLRIATTNVEHESQLNNGLSAEDNISINNRIFAEYQPLPFDSSLVATENDDESEDKE
jgi:hypothetical protein